jgi:hypothetical protein
VHGQSLSRIEKKDAGIKAAVYQALWRDSVLRVLEYYEIDVRVKNEVVYLNGHVLSTASQNRIENAIHEVPGILGIKNNLVLDDKLNLQVPLVPIRGSGKKCLVQETIRRERQLWRIC